MAKTTEKYEVLYVLNPNLTEKRPRPSWKSSRL